MAANGNTNGYGNMNRNGISYPPMNGANSELLPHHENFIGAKRLATFRQCNPPFYDGSTLGMPAQDWLYTRCYENTRKYLGIPCRYAA